MLQAAAALRPRLSRWLSGSDRPTIGTLRRDIDRRFLYRGVSTLELRGLMQEDGNVAVSFYARPIFPSDRRIKDRTREAAFAEQLFADTLAILEALWESSQTVQRIDLSAWVKTVDGAGRELSVLRLRVTRDQAARVATAKRLAPVDVLKHLGARTRIDRHGNLREEGAL